MLKLYIYQFLGQKKYWIDLPTSLLEGFEILDFKSKIDFNPSFILNAQIIELNHLAIIISDFKRKDIDKINVLLKCLDDLYSIYDVLNLCLNIHNYTVIEDISTFEELAHYHYKDAKDDTDFNTLGQQIAQEENGFFIDHYYIACRNITHNEYYNE